MIDFRAFPTTMFTFLTNGGEARALTPCSGESKIRNDFLTVMDNNGLYVGFNAFSFAGKNDVHYCRVAAAAKNSLMLFFSFINLRWSLLARIILP